MWHMHASTFDKWHKKNKTKNKSKKVTLHILIDGAMRGCGLTSLVFRINDKICDLRERDVTIRSELWTTNIRSPWFWVIREWVTLWGLILQSLGCTSRLGPLHTRAKSRGHGIARAQNKVSKVPTHLRNHVVWSRTLKCSAKSYVTEFSTKCYFNECLFMWDLHTWWNRII